MSGPHLASIQDSLTVLASQPGVAWAGFMDSASASLVSVHADGTCPRDETIERILTEAILSAANTLAGRLGLGPARELQHSFESGGMLIQCLDANRCLILSHHAGVSSAMLRLALRDAALQFPVPPVPSSPPPGPRTPPGLGEVFALDPKDLSPCESGVYNPFSPA
jgi:hypothetical protein